MAKKRTSLDAVLPAAKNTQSSEPGKDSTGRRIHSNHEAPAGKRPHVKQQALYLKHPVYRQLRVLAFEEEKKMHDLCMEALNLLFAHRGLPSIAELQSE